MAEPREPEAEEPESHEDRFIPKERVPVFVDFLDGRTLQGVVFVDYDTRLLDFVNSPDEFIPFAERGERIRLISKNQIVAIRHAREGG